MPKSTLQTEIREILIGYQDEFDGDLASSQFLQAFSEAIRRAKPENTWIEEIQTGFQFGIDEYEANLLAEVGTPETPQHEKAGNRKLPEVLAIVDRIADKECSCHCHPSTHVLKGACSHPTFCSHCTINTETDKEELPKVPLKHIDRETFLARAKRLRQDYAEETEHEPWCKTNMALGGSCHCQKPTEHEEGTK